MKPPEAKYKTRIDILVKKGQEEVIPEHLYNLTGSGFWIEDREELTLLKCYPESVETFLQSLYSTDLNVIEVGSAQEEERDYGALTRKYFRPIRIGSLTIRPPWTKRQESRREIVIEPGMAFGTGRHESTKIMVKLMDQVDMKMKKVLDIGCGSGILALYAQLLGAREIVAVDNDMEAVLNAKKNIALNDTPGVKVVCADLQHVRGIYDVVLANLDIGIFTRHSEAVKRLVAPDGLLVISGILGREKKRLLSLFHRCPVIRMERRNAWHGFLLKRGNHSL